MTLNDKIYDLYTVFAIFVFVCQLYITLTPNPTLFRVAIPLFWQEAYFFAMVFDFTSPRIIFWIPFLALLIKAAHTERIWRTAEK